MLAICRLMMAVVTTLVIQHVSSENMNETGSVITNPERWLSGFTLCQEKSHTLAMPIQPQARPLHVFF